MDFRIFLILPMLSLTISADFRQPRLNLYEVTPRRHQERGQNSVDERRSGRSFFVVGNAPNLMFREPPQMLHQNPKVDRALDTMDENNPKSTKKHQLKVVPQIPNFVPLPAGHFISTRPMTSPQLVPQSSSIPQGHFVNGQNIPVYPKIQTPFAGQPIAPMPLTFNAPPSPTLPLPSMTQPKFTVNSNSLSSPTKGGSNAKPKYLYVVNNMAIPVPTQSVQRVASSIPVNSGMGQIGQSLIGQRQERTLGPMNPMQMSTFSFPQQQQQQQQQPRMNIQPAFQQMNGQGQGQHMSGQFGVQWPGQVQPQPQMTMGSSNPVVRMQRQMTQPHMPQYFAHPQPQTMQIFSHPQNPMQFPSVLNQQQAGQRARSFPESGMPLSHGSQMQMGEQPIVNSEETRGHEKRQADWPSVDHQVVLDIFKLYDYLGQKIGGSR